MAVQPWDFRILHKCTGDVRQVRLVTAWSTERLATSYKIRPRLDWIQEAGRTSAHILMFSAGSSHSCPGLSPLEEHNEAGWVDRSSPSCWPELPGARPALDGRRWSRFAQVTTADFSHGSNGWKRLAAWKTPRGREAREGCPRFPSAWRQNGIGHEPQVPPLHQKQSRNFERLQQG
jgi:hypothetical protein